MFMIVTISIFDSHNQLTTGYNHLNIYSKILFEKINFYS